MNRQLSLKLISTVLVVALPYTATATATATTLQQQLTKCASISKDKPRLKCFDQISLKPSQQLVVDKQELFGFESKQTLLTPEKVLVEVVNINKGPRGKSTFTLANGQVWKQTDSIGYRLKPEKQVFIKKGALGSFFLGQVDRNKKIRIKRIK